MTPRRRARSVLVGVALAAGVLVATGGSTSAGAQTTGTPAQTETIVLASGVDGVGLRAIDDGPGWGGTGQPGRELPVVAVAPRFNPPFTQQSTYVEIPGARWITDRFTDDGSTQMRASELAEAGNRLRGAATPLPLPAVPIRDGNIVDYGEEWLSTRTFLHTWTAPPNRSVASARLEFAADNNVAISVVNGGRTTELVGATCDRWATCGTPDGAANFRLLRTVDLPSGALGAGDNEFRFRVQDWGTVVGLTFKITIVLGAPASDVPPCASDPDISCSLTAARLPGLPAGQLRYCYKAPDGITRSFWVDGVPYTLASGTWTDAPAPASGSVQYPQPDSTPIALAKIIDPQLRNCPGALTS